MALCQENEWQSSSFSHVANGSPDRNTHFLKQGCLVLLFIHMCVNVRASLKSVVSHQEIPVNIHNVLTPCKKQKQVTLLPSF